MAPSALCLDASKSCDKNFSCYRIVTSQSYFKTTESEVFKDTRSPVEKEGLTPSVRA